MISTRALAVFIAAFALLASALIAVPFDGTGAPGAGEPVGASEMADLPVPAAKTLGSVGRSLSLPATEGDEAQVPRLWLGSPMVR